MFLVRIPQSTTMNHTHTLYVHFTMKMQGNATTEIWQKDGPRRTFEWGKGSLFAPPKNTYYRMHNLGREPVLYFGVTTGPRLFNGMFVSGGGGAPSPTSLYEVVFDFDHDFTELYDGSEEYFA